MKIPSFLPVILAVTTCLSCTSGKTDKESLATADFISTENNTEETYVDYNRISGFKSLTMKGVGNIYYEQSDSTNLKIKGPLNLIDKIIVENKGEELYISFDPKYKRPKDIKNIYYHITAPELNQVDIKGVTTFQSSGEWVSDNLKLSVEGVGQIYAKDIKSRELDIEMDGVGKISLNVKCDEINTRIKGVGKVEISGETGTLNTDNKGIGKIDISNLKVRNR